METIALLSLALGASWCAGINLYATVAVLGLLHRYTTFTLPPDLQVLAHDWVLWPSMVLYTVEFFADKIPALDSAWDTIHTFIRIPAGAAIAAGALGELPTEVSVLAALLGGGAAAFSHVTKATARVATHASGGSIVTPVVSVAEDGLVIGTVALVVANPIVAMILTALMMVAAYFILRFFWRLTKKAFRWLTGAKATTDATTPPAAPA